MRKKQDSKLNCQINSFTQLKENRHAFITIKISCDSNNYDFNDH